MPSKELNKLNDMQLRKAKPPESGTKCLGDGGGLRLLVTANGNKRWQMEYVSPVTHKRRLAGFGTYYDNGGGVSLTEAREKRDEFRRMIRKGLDPLDEQEKEAAARRREKEAQEALQQTFRKTAEEWFDVRTREFSDRTRNAIYRAIQYLTPHIGNIPLAKLRITDVSKALEPLFDRVETCHRVAGIAHRICRYGATKGYVEGDFLSALPDVLPKKPSVAHHAAITDPAEFGRLLLALDEYRGDISTVYCLRMLPYVFVRSSDIRNARWSEIDLEARMWTIPAARMKMKREHVVPLAHQVVDMLRELKDHTGHTGLLFPSPHDRRRGLSDVALLTALRRMGYGRDEMTVHGFRGVASTLLNEQGFRPDVIEMQLSHVEKNNVRASYNFAEYMQERRGMMQRWADYLDELKKRAGRKA